MLNFDARWEEAIKQRARATGKDEHYSGIDVFVFPKGMYPEIRISPIGRLWFDHWLIKAVRQQDLPVWMGLWWPRCCIRIMDMIMWRAAKSRYGAGKKPSKFSIVWRRGTCVHVAGCDA